MSTRFHEKDPCVPLEELRAERLAVHDAAEVFLVDVLVIETRAEPENVPHSRHVSNSIAAYS